MHNYEPPILKNDLVCIASINVDIELLSTVCCYINDSDRYFAIFEMPVIENPLIDTDDIEDDDYFTNAVVKIATQKLLNSIASIKCRKIILVGLSEQQKKYLNLEEYWNVTLIEINHISDISEKLKFLNKQFNGVVKCVRKEISRGLLCAKNNNKLLIVDENAHSINDLVKNKCEGLIVIESKNDISDIIIVNYAFSVNADAKFIHGLKSAEVKDLKNKFVKWKRDKSYGAYLSILNIMNELMKNINVNEYDYLTFFTDGVPYGAFFNSIIPCSHVLRSITVDLFIFNNIFFERRDHYFGSSIVFSPNPPDLTKYTTTEVENVCNVHKKFNLSVKKLLNKDATVKAFDYYVGYYPYDILHICSHGGETDGYYVIQEFIDREGIKHTVEYEEVVGFSHDEGDYVNISSKKITKFFDGFVWMSDELRNKKYPQYVYNDMFKAICNEKEGSVTNRKKIDYLIEGSCHVKCYDDIHQGQFHVLASQNFPLIFNNTCNSWEEFATQLLASGCRAYIGTLWDIGNETAANSSYMFYEYAFDTNIINAVHNMINAIENDKYKDIYLFCGLHFASLKKSNILSKDKIIQEQVASLKKWIVKSKNIKSQQVLRNCINIIRFLMEELTPYYDQPDIIELLIISARICYYLNNRLI